MATTENADWVCGEAVTILITIAGEGSIDGWTFAAAIARAHGVTPVIIKTSTDGILISDAEGRIIQLSISHADSTDLPSGGYVWDLWRADAGFEACLSRGKIELKPKVSA